MAAVTLATINSTLLNIKRDTRLTAKVLSGQGTSAEEAKEGLKKRILPQKPQTNVIEKPGTKKETKKSDGLFGNFDLKKFMTLAGLLGLGAVFREQIKNFGKGLLEGLGKWLFGEEGTGDKGLIGEWWEGYKKDIEDAWKNLKDVTGIAWVEKESKVLWEKYVKPFFMMFKPMKDMVMDALFGKMGYDELGNETGRKGGLFGPVRDKFNEVSAALGKLSDAIGLTELENGDRQLSTGGWIAGLTALSALAATIGIKKTVKLPFVIAGKTFKTLWGVVKWFGNGLLALGANMFGVGTAGVAAQAVAGGGMPFPVGPDGKQLKPGDLNEKGKVIGLDGKGTTVDPKDKAGRDKIRRLAAERSAARGGFRGLLSRLGLTMAGFAAGGVATLGAMAAVAGAGAAVYGLYKLAEYEDESRKGRVRKAIEDKTISQDSVDFARQAAVADMGDRPELKSFEEWEKLKFGENITGGSSVERRMRTERQQKYQEEHSAARAELEGKILDILGNFIDDKRGKQLEMVSDLAQGRGLFGAMLKKGVISLKEGVPINEVAKELTTYIENNPGKPITREVMEDSGIVFSEEGFKKEFSVPNVRPDHAFHEKSSLSALEGFDPKTMTMMGLGVKSGAFGENFNERYKKLNDLQKRRELELIKDNAKQTSAVLPTSTQPVQVSQVINQNGGQSSSGRGTTRYLGVPQSDRQLRGMGLVTQIG